MRLRVVADSAVRSPENPKRQRLLAVFTIAVVIGAAGLATSVLLAGGHDGHANIVTAVSLVVLTLLATHSEQVFGDETAINGSIIVVMAGSGIAYAGGPVFVPIVCGLVAGLHWHHLRDCAVRKVIVNMSFTTLSALVATEVARVLSAHRPGVVGIALCGLATVMAYWVTDNLLVALVLTIVDERSLRVHARELVRSETGVIPFALLGFVCGATFLLDRPLFGLVAIVVLLIATKLVVFQGRDGSAVRGTWAIFRVAPIAASVALLGSGDAAAIRGGGTVALLALTAFVSVIVLDRFGAGFGLAALVLCTVAAFVGLRSDGSFEVALIVGLAACGGFVVPRRRRPHNRITILAAAMSAAMASAAVIATAPFESPSSLVGAIVAGGLAGLAGLLAWHALVGITLTLELGRSIIPSAAALAAHDVALVVIAGVCGGAAGVLGSRLGTFGPFVLVTLAVLATCLVCAVSAHRKASPSEADRTDDELLDVLRSALLDLPASRLPD